MSDVKGRATRRPTWPSPNGRIPSWLPAFNGITRLLLGAGVPMGPNALVTIRGRKSGLPRATPMAVIEDAGRRWVWAPSGDVQWVRNLRAAGRATISTRRGREEVSAIELDAARRIEFFGNTLVSIARRMPFGFQFYRAVDRVDLNDPVEAAEGRAVFELHAINDAGVVQVKGA